MSEKKSSFGSLGHARRSFKNYALQPLLQVRLGLYFVLLSIAFSLFLGGVLYMNLAKFVEIVLELTGVEDEVRDLLIQYIDPARMQILGVLIVYVIVTMIMSIKLTHKLVGPTVAFRRHIRMISEGNWEHRTVLRDGDAFAEVADDLNRLSEELSRKYGAKFSKDS